MKKKDDPPNPAPKDAILAAIQVKAVIGGVELTKILYPNMSWRDSEMVGKALIKLGESLL